MTICLAGELNEETSYPDTEEEIAQKEIEY
jgi:hypothetical protein